MAIYSTGKSERWLWTAFKFKVQPGKVQSSDMHSTSQPGQAQEEIKVTSSVSSISSSSFSDRFAPCIRPLGTFGRRSGRSGFSLGGGTGGKTPFFGWPKLTMTGELSAMSALFAVLAIGLFTGGKSGWSNPLPLMFPSFETGTGGKCLSRVPLGETLVLAEELFIVGPREEEWGERSLWPGDRTGDKLDDRSFEATSNLVSESLRAFSIFTTEKHSLHCSANKNLMLKSFTSVYTQNFKYLLKSDACRMMWFISHLVY